MQRGLDRAKLDQDIINSARYLKAHELSNGRLGATGFCWGGGMTNRLAVALGSDLQAGVPFYGPAAASEDVPKIKAALLIIYAGTDRRVNAMWPAYEAALKANGVTYEMQLFEGTLHGFPQQLDSPLQRGGRGAGLEPHGGILSEISCLVFSFQFLVFR